MELFGYFSFFWLFVLNGKFRRAQVEEWREGGTPERLHIAHEAAVSLIFGVVVPAGLLLVLSSQFA
jgi:hypothetical protein